MNKKLFLLLATGLIAMLLSCSGDASDPSSVQAQAKLSVTAQDANTGEFVDAKVTLLSTGKSADFKASTQRPVEFKVPVGRQIVRVESKGYAIMEVQSGVSADVAGSVYVAQERSHDVKLYKETASLSGFVFYTDEEGKKVPAKDVIVRITFGEYESCDPSCEGYYDLGIANRIVDSEKTGDDGKFTFENLPSVGTSFRIEALPTFINGAYFGEKLIKDFNDVSSSLLLGATAQVVNVEVFDVEKIVFKLEDYTNVIEDTAPVVFTFSDDINPNSITSGMISVLGVPVSVKWAGNTLTITNNQGVWNGDFSVSGFTIKSAKGASLSVASKSVRVNKPDLSKAVVEGLEVLNHIAGFREPASNGGLGLSNLSAESGLVSLRWNKVKGATGYDIYATKKDAGKWVKVNNVAINDTAMSGCFNTDCTAKLDGNIYTFRVQALNAKSKSNLLNASNEEIEVKDITAPSFASGYSFTNSLSDNLVHATFTPNAYLSNALHGTTRVEKVGIVVIEFNEPMNKTALLIGATPIDIGGKTSTGMGKLKIDLNITDANWDADGKKLTLNLNVDPGAALAFGTVNAQYSLGGFKDKGDNAFLGIYGSSAISSPRIPTVNLKFDNIKVASTDEAICNGGSLNTAQCNYEGYCAMVANYNKSVCVDNLSTIFYGVEPYPARIAYCKIAYNGNNVTASSWCKGHYTQPCDDFGYSDSNCRSYCKEPDYVRSSYCKQWAYDIYGTYNDIGYCQAYYNKTLTDNIDISGGDANVWSDWSEIFPLCESYNTSSTGTISTPTRQCKLFNVTSIECCEGYNNGGASVYDPSAYGSTYGCDFNTYCPDKIGSYGCSQYCATFAPGSKPSWCD